MISKSAALIPHTNLLDPPEQLTLFPKLKNLVKIRNGQKLVDPCLKMKSLGKLSIYIFVTILLSGTRLALVQNTDYMVEKTYNLATNLGYM